MPNLAFPQALALKIISKIIVNVEATKFSGSLLPEGVYTSSLGCYRQISYKEVSHLQLHQHMRIAVFPHPY